MKVLVTGSNGFIGKNILNLLKDEFDFIQCSRTTEHSVTDLQKLLLIDDVDVVIHLAAEANVGESYEKPYKYYNFNINSSLNIAEFCRIKKISKLIYLNTYVYGNNPNNPIDENHKIELISPYTKSKYISEKLFMHYFDHDIDVISLRLFNLYGVFQSNKFFIANLINQIVNGIKPIIDNEETRRDYLYINDLINLIRLIILKKNEQNKFQIFNVGSGISYSGIEIIKHVEKLLDKNIEYINMQFTKKNELKDCYANISKTQKHFNWKLNYSIADGLNDYMKILKK